MVKKGKKQKGKNLERKNEKQSIHTNAV